MATVIGIAHLLVVLLCGGVIATYLVARWGRRSAESGDYDVGQYRYVAHMSQRSASTSNTATYRIIDDRGQG